MLMENPVVTSFFGFRKYLKILKYFLNMIIDSLFGSVWKINIFSTRLVLKGLRIKIFQHIIEALNFCDLVFMNEINDAMKFIVNNDIMQACRALPEVKVCLEQKDKRERAALQGHGVQRVTSSIFIY